ncbi:oligosaccharide repeat unit polymerase [Bacillus timonensis]|uniref:Oligosaccharide repeat unit polymerase n=1 Tax=Bacillus timonensis TaxID=1033734 RepID=A0A4V3V6Z3_9BACI|nr:O-antigen polymerase [Bacillus timonensis]THE09063.1 oligosaccharide repeat unit polymerase [Bacillus timonensis]
MKTKLFGRINKTKQVIRHITKQKYFPLILLESYLFISVILFYFGPINYPNVSVFKTVSLILLYNFFLVIGYLVAEKKITLIENKKMVISFNKIRIMILTGAIISIFFSYVSFVSYSSSINPLIIIKDILGGISDPGEAYLRNIQIAREGGVITKFMTLLSPVTFLTIPLGLFFYFKLKTFEKIVVAIAIVTEILTFIIKGTNFGIFKIAIIFVVIFMLNRGYEKINLITKGLIGFALFYFLFSISDRMQLTEIPNTVFNIEIDKQHILFKLLPVSLSVPIMLAMSYVSQGYYALSLTSLYNFESTYGFGSGRFLISNMQSLLDINIWERTYQYKMDPLWDSRVNWHTIYVWFANDVGIYGVLVIMAIIGFLFCLVLKDAKEQKNIFAIILLPLYIIMLLFIPANNIIFDNPLMFMPFVIFNIVWIFSKRWSVRT